MVPIQARARFLACFESEIVFNWPPWHSKTNTISTQSRAKSFIFVFFRVRVRTERRLNCRFSLWDYFINLGYLVVSVHRGVWFGGLKSVNFCTNLYIGPLNLFSLDLKKFYAAGLYSNMIQICINKTKICIINVCVYNAKVQIFLTFFSNEKCFFRQCLKQSKKSHSNCILVSV